MRQLACMCDFVPSRIPSSLPSTTQPGLSGKTRSRRESASSGWASGPCYTERTATSLLQFTSNKLSRVTRSSLGCEVRSGS
eukprot:3991993-Pyramimonas_sp.AAC.1